MCDIQANYMESSTNLHHQVHEEHLVGSSNSASSLPSSSSCFSVADNDHVWRSPTFFLNNGNIHAICGDEGNPNSLNNPIIQEVGFPWPNDISINQSTSHQDQQQQQLITDRIKEEPSSSTTSSDYHHHHHHHHHHDTSNFAKFSDMLGSSSSTSPSEMQLLKNALSATYKNLHQPPPFPPSMQHYQNTTTNNKGISTTFSQIFPSVNISNMSSNSNSNNNNINNNNNMASAAISRSSIDQMASNVPAGGFDLFATARLLSGETSLNNQPAPNSINNNNNLLELFEGSPQFSVDYDLQQQHPNDLQLCNRIANNVSSFNNNGSQAESTHQMTTKKQCFESRASCPPLKVRKEKLGDRIAALQQLVSPFGKTDTASVLMEAIGYIKFLQNQVETLSVPYMELASRSKSTNIQRASDDEYYEGEETISTDLRSRGLCLVPTSCMTYINIASDAINGGVWPPNFNPAYGF